MTIAPCTRAIGVAQCLQDENCLARLCLFETLLLDGRGDSRVRHSQHVDDHCLPGGDDVHHRECDRGDRSELLLPAVGVALLASFSGFGQWGCTFCRTTVSSRGRFSICGAKRMGQGVRLIVKNCGLAVLLQQRLCAPSTPTDSFKAENRARCSWQDFTSSERVRQQSSRSLDLLAMDPRTDADAVSHNSDHRGST